MILHVTNRLATVTKGANRVTLMTTAAKVKKKTLNVTVLKDGFQSHLIVTSIML